MRPLFKVPGRAAVDCITSWIGDGTLGVMLTCNQYEGGYYSAKEASIIATLFSAVSITFTLVVLDTVGLLDYFGIYYLIVCFVGIVCAIVCPHLYPLRKKPNTYLVEGKAAPDTLPEGYKSNVEYGHGPRHEAALPSTRASVNSSRAAPRTPAACGSAFCPPSWPSVLSL